MPYNFRRDSCLELRTPASTFAATGVDLYRSCFATWLWCPSPLLVVRSSRNCEMGAQTKVLRKFANKEDERGKEGGVGQQQDQDDGSAPQAVMDPKLWSTLPDHLIEKVAAQLPIPVFLSLRAVCQRWNLLASSPQFLQEATAASPLQSYLICFHKSGSVAWEICVMYGIDKETWYKVPLHFLPCPYNDVVAAGGLLCFFSHGSDNDTLIVSNPATKSFRELPVLPCRLHLLRVMVVDKKTGGYKVIAAGRDYRTRVFDSSSLSWSNTCALPLGVDFPMRTINCGGCLYGVVGLRASTVYRYDLDEDLWYELRVQQPAEHVLQLELVELCGHVLAIALVRAENECHSLQIWKLDRARKMWQEVDEVPSEICGMLLSLNNVWKEFSCIGWGVELWFTSGGTEGLPQAVVYDISQQTWRWTSCCPPMQLGMERGRFTRLRGLVLDLQLNAAV